MISGYLDQGLMVKDPKLLRKNYAKTPFIYLDILSILPTDIAYLFLDSQCSETVPCPVIGKEIIIILSFFSGVIINQMDVIIKRIHWSVVLLFSSLKSSISSGSDARLFFKDRDSDKLSKRISYYKGGSHYITLDSLECMLLFCYQVNKYYAMQIIFVDIIILF